MTHKLLPDEKVLPDDYLVHDMYVYICDNVFTRYTGGDTSTVGLWKRNGRYKEIRRCNLFGHNNARLGDKVEP